jgi:hypothetical protein
VNSFSFTERRGKFLSRLSIVCLFGTVLFCGDYALLSIV